MSPRLRQEVQAVLRRGEGGLNVVKLPVHECVRLPMLEAQIR
jgi:hypothetical protein